VNPVDLERSLAVPHGAPAPLSAALFAADLPRSALELTTALAAAPWLGTAPRGDGHPVLLIPGLLAADPALTVMHGFLRELGYATEGWSLGLNVGRWDVLAPLLDTFDRLHERHARPVSLVGWSMGGLYAREIARRRPTAVRLLAQLGTPFGADAKSNPNWPIYEFASGDPADSAPRQGATEPRPPVPTLSIWSRSDGHVDWRNCVERAGGPHDAEIVENVEVISSHNGLRHHPHVLWTIATRLANTPERRDRGVPPARSPGDLQ
jgi:dienelactone hydrolase